MNHRELATLGLATALMGLTGCVIPEAMDATLVNRYQEAMAGRGPQPRLGAEGIGLLQPVRGATGPALTVERIVDKTIETIRVYSPVEAAPAGTRPAATGPADSRNVRLKTILKITRPFRDPKTGQLVGRTQVQESEAILPPEHPDYLDVRAAAPGAAAPRVVTQTIRVGEQHEDRSMIQGAAELIRLTLQEAVARALANNLDIRVVSYDPAISREEMMRAAAAFDFILFGSANYAKQEEKSASVWSGETRRTRDLSFGVKQHALTGAEWSLAFTMTRSWDMSLFNELHTRWTPVVALEVTQPLLRNAGPEFNLAKLRVAALNVRINEQAFRDKVEDVVAQTIVAYWTLGQARQRYAIQEAMLDRSRETFERMKARELVDATQVMIKQAEANVRINEADVILRRKEVQDAQDRLARLLADAQINAVSGYEIVPITEPERQKFVVNAADQLMTALTHNPVLEQTRLAIAAAEVNVRVAENQTLPRLDLKASTGLQGMSGQWEESLDKMLTGNWASYAVGLVLEYPIGNRDAEANLRARRLEHTKAIVQMQNTVDQLAVAVNEQVRQVTTMYMVLEAQKAAVEASRVELQALEDTERIRGRLTPEFLRTKLDAQRRLRDAEDAEAAATVNYNAAIAALARATGTVLELNRVVIDVPKALDRTVSGSGPPSAPMTSPPTPASGPALGPPPAPVGPPPATVPAPAPPAPAVPPRSPGAPPAPAVPTPTTPPPGEPERPARPPQAPVTERRAEPASVPAPDSEPVPPLPPPPPPRGAGEAQAGA